MDIVNMYHSNFFKHSSALNFGSLIMKTRLLNCVITILQGKSHSLHPRDPPSKQLMIL